VEKLWTARAKPVEKLTTKNYFWPDRARIGPPVDVDSFFAARFA
jgi:hypothetical protein